MASSRTNMAEIEYDFNNYVLIRVLLPGNVSFISTLGAVPFPLGAHCCTAMFLQQPRTDKLIRENKFLSINYQFKCNYPAA